MKTLIKKLAASILTFAMVVSLMTGCGSSSDSFGTSDNTAATTGPDSSSGSASSAGAVIRVGITGAPADLSPWSGSSVARNMVLPSIYQTLLEPEKLGGDLTCVMAEKYEQIDNYTFRIYLRQNITDSAGNPFTSEDAKFSFESAKKLGNVSNIKAVEEVKIIDNYTFDLVLNVDSIGLMGQICLGTFMVTQAAYEASADNMAEDPVGTTGYILSDYVSGSTLTLDKRDDFWQGEDGCPLYAANADQIVFTVITEASQMSIALETGQIDIAENITAKEAERFTEGGESADGFTTYQNDDCLGAILYFNCDTGSMFESKDLRQAVCYAIDSQALIDGAEDGHGVVMKTMGPYMYSDYLASWDSEEYYPYNVDKAKELLQTSGYDGGGQKIRILVQNNPTRVRVAEIVQSYLLQIGIDSEIISVDSGVFTSYKFDSTQWDIKIDWNAGGSGYLSTLWSSMLDTKQFSNGTSNFVHDDKLQELLEGCIGVSNHNDETVEAFHAYLKEQAYCIGLYSPVTWDVTVNTIDNITLNSKLFVLPGAAQFSGNK